jgi:hypothetical protein
MSIGVRYTAWQLNGRAARDIRRYVLEHPLRSGPFEARRTVSSVKIPADG